jgi:aspartyl-tRNA(Asn)/glutamyl-tRNA(Gln) amidotransferase subunit A
MTYPFNLISQIPAMSVPSGTSPAGIPTGLQIVARTFDDHRVFRAAAAFERARPWRERRPPL